jgi:hypothetical protein
MELASVSALPLKWEDWAGWSLNLKWCLCHDVLSWLCHLHFHFGHPVMKMKMMMGSYGVNVHWKLPQPHHLHLGHPMVKMMGLSLACHLFAWKHAER